jgi:hypothetical protein
MTDPRELVKRASRATWQRLAALVGPYRCRSCGQPLRRLVSSDLTPEAVRTYRLAGTLGGLLAAGYVCRDCTRPGEWVLIE